MKKVLINFSILTICLLLMIGCSQNNKSSITGIYLKSTNGINLIITENNEPICMNNKSGNENIFNTLKSGDKIEVTFEYIRETYPAQTDIYSCKLIEKGTINNIPKDVLISLEEMDWNFDLSN